MPIIVKITMNTVSIEMKQKPYAPAVFNPPGDNTKAVAWPEELSQHKIMTTSGVELATFPLVAQCLN
jgi:hypothetical protein